MTINGKEAKFHWGMVAFEVYQNAIVSAAKKRKSLTVSSVSSITAILWGGILNYYERVMEDCPFDYAEIYDYVEKSALSGDENKEITACVVAFNDSVIVQNVSKANEGEQEKKS